MTAAHPDDSPLITGDGMTLPWDLADDSVTALIDNVVERCSQSFFTEFLEHPQFMDQLRASVGTNVRILRSVLRGEPAITGADQAPVVGLARLQADMSIPQQLLQRSYRLSFALQLDAWSAPAAGWAASTGASGETVAQWLRWLAKRVLDYQDVVASRVADAHARDEAALSQSRAHMRRHIVRSLLRGDAQLSPAELAVLGYPLEAHHLALLLPDVTEDVAALTVNRLARAVSSQYHLVYGESGDSIIWCCRDRPFAPDHVARITASCADEPRIISVSTPHEGRTGFVTAYQDVVSTQEVRLALGAGTPAVMAYDDVALDVLMLADRHQAIEFMSAELGPLLERNIEATRTLDTLRASLESTSHVAAAAALGVHEHTVRNRLARASERLGRPWDARKPELAVALRIHRLLGGA